MLQTRNTYIDTCNNEEVDGSHFNKCQLSCITKLNCGPVRTCMQRTNLTSNPQRSDSSCCDHPLQGTPGSDTQQNSCTTENSCTLYPAQLPAGHLTHRKLCKHNKRTSPVQATIANPSHMTSALHLFLWLYRLPNQ